MSKPDVEAEVRRLKADLEVAESRKSGVIRDLKAEVERLKAQAMAAPVDPAAWWKLNDEAKALRAEVRRLMASEQAQFDRATENYLRATQAEAKLSEAEAALYDGRADFASFKANPPHRECLAALAAEQSKIRAADQVLATYPISQTGGLHDRVFKLGQAWQAQRERAERLREAIRGLLIAADAEWENQRGGHDWPAACEEARAALRESEGGEK